MIIADARDGVNWQAMMYFVKQVVRGMGASPQGNHYSVYAFGNNVAQMATFPVGSQQTSQYNVNTVFRYLDAAQSFKPTGRGDSINLALRAARQLLTDQARGARTGAFKVICLSWEVWT